MEKRQEFEKQQEEFYNNLETGETSECTSCGEQHFGTSPECVPCILG